MTEKSPALNVSGFKYAPNAPEWLRDAIKRVSFDGNVPRSWTDIEMAETIWAEFVKRGLRK